MDDENVVRHAVARYSAVKKNKTEESADQWTGLEYIILREVTKR